MDIELLVEPMGLKCLHTWRGTSTQTSSGGHWQEGALPQETMGVIWKSTLKTLLKLPVDSFNTRVKTQKYTSLWTGCPFVSAQITSSKDPLLNRLVSTFEKSMFYIYTLTFLLRLLVKNREIRILYKHFKFTWCTLWQA